ncbi:MAG: GTPase, partial [Acidimicrobiaceae bacterium]|nr:GTPase [Acidimicrobiaceae bacterium]
MSTVRSAAVGQPVVAIVGRPNVGKSTLLNRVIGRREAIEEEKPGVTRDRKPVDAEWNGRTFTLVDTGGWLDTEHALDRQVSKQAERAIADADLVLMVVDVTVGVTDEDERVARLLRRSGKPVMLVVNKVDSERRESESWEFTRLGLGDPYAISSLHGRGTGDMLDDVVARL